MWKISKCFFFLKHFKDNKNISETLSQEEYIYEHIHTISHTVSGWWHTSKTLEGGVSQTQVENLLLLCCIHQWQHNVAVRCVLCCMWHSSGEHCSQGTTTLEVTYSLLITNQCTHADIHSRRVAQKSQVGSRAETTFWEQIKDLQMRVKYTLELNTWGTQKSSECSILSKKKGPLSWDHADLTTFHRVGAKLFLSVLVSYLPSQCVLFSERFQRKVAIHHQNCLCPATPVGTSTEYLAQAHTWSGTRESERKPLPRPQGTYSLVWKTEEPANDSQAMRSKHKLLLLCKCDTCVWEY